MLRILSHMHTCIDVCMHIHTYTHTHTHAPVAVAMLCTLMAIFFKPSGPWYTPYNAAMLAEGLDTERRGEREEEREERL